MEEIMEPVNPGLEEMIGKTWNVTDPDRFLQELAGNAETLGRDFIETGNRHYERLKADPDESEKGHKITTSYIITYQLADQAKAFLLLWRDVLFQMQKAQLLLTEKLIEEEAVGDLKEESGQVIRSAADDLSDKYSKAVKPGKGRPFQIEKMLAKWRLQQNPWPVYAQQIETITQQCRDLVTQNKQLLHASGIFQQIRDEVNDLMQDCRKEVAGIEGLIGQTMVAIESIANEDKEQSLGKIAAKLEDIESENPLDHHLNAATLHLEQQIEALPEKISAAVSIHGGIIEIQEINLRRRARQWLESEIIPLLYEAWETTENVYNGMKMALVNIRNRALLLSAGSREGKRSDFELSDLSQPLQTQSGIGKQAMEALIELNDLVCQRLAEDFMLSSLYETTRPFLPLPLQSTINQLQFNQNKVVVRAGRWLRLQMTALKRFKRTVEQEEILSVSEKIVRLIDSRQGDPANTHYSGIFLTRGYVGESFFVGRKNELSHMGKLVQQWKQGFRGSVLISGQALSGKSLFCELVANRFFPEHTIRLQPGATVQVEGRKMNVKYDLSAALEFIRKYTLNVRPLIWIDDLELWWEPGTPLSKNARALIRFIDNYSHQIFFMVAMGNSLKAHLQTFLNIGRAFQAEMKMDYMPASEIRDAILIRHGATHKKLVDKGGEEMTPQQFNKKIQMIHRYSRGNIGDALLKWSGSTFKLDENQVYNDFAARYSLPDFLNADSALLLSSILLQKRTNEYRLRKLFGPAFSEKYSSSLQRLINVGLLKRQLDGWLEINELIAGDLGHLLDRKKHIQYH